MDITITERKEVRLIAPLIEEVQNLHARLLPSVYKTYEKEGIAAAMEKMLSDEMCRVFVAQLNGETIAYVLVLIKEVPENAFHYAYKLLHIDQIVVAKNHRQTGVGSLLLDKVESLAKELSVNRIELDHLHINNVAANFFLQKGYTPYREKRFKTID